MVFVVLDREGTLPLRNFGEVSGSLTGTRGDRGLSPQVALGAAEQGSLRGHWERARACA